jgi:DNA polymerase elongation subunit (family B)
VSKKKRGDLGPRILTIDIETSPNLAHVWSLWNVNVGLSQLRESGDVMCFAAKWHGSNKIMYYSTYHHGREAMLQAAHDLLSEADIVVHYNGVRFDIPHLNRAFVEAGMTPPAPYAQVDLFRVVKRNFRFPSNKLDYVVQALALGAKDQHQGHQLWVDCIAGKRSAWDTMRAYNKQDVHITEKLYDKLLPWISPHPAVGLYSFESHSCPACGSAEVKPRGRAYTSVSVFQRYRCDDCGRWSRGSKRVSGVALRLTN